MAANRRKQDDKNLEVLRELISLNGNKYCIDCNQRGPTYVNTTIGSFVCSKCSGMLRGLTPPHRVKSISMATFTPEEIEYVKARGNDFCRRVWLGLYEGESVNFSDEQSVKDFMSDKYEKKRYHLECLDALPGNDKLRNGNTSTKIKLKIKSGNNGPPTSLIPITPPTSKNSDESVLSTIKPVSNFLSTPNDQSHSLARPVSNYPQPMTTNVPAPAPVPDFPVDFSTANIYNSNQFNELMNNNLVSQPSVTSTSFNVFNSPSTTANDRYAALADLDLALRQQNMKNMEDSHITNKNPFQSPVGNDVFGNKNPFFNGGWSVAPAPLHVNPFMSNTNNGNLVNSKNPFL